MLNNKRIHELLDLVKEVQKPKKFSYKDEDGQNNIVTMMQSPIYEILQHLLEMDIKNDPGGRAFCGDCYGDLVLEPFKQILIDPNGKYHDCRNGLSHDEYRVIKEKNLKKIRRNKCTMNIKKK